MTRNSIVKGLGVLSFFLALGCGGGASPPVSTDPGNTGENGPTNIPCPHELKVNCYDKNPCTEDSCLPNTFECHYETLPKDGNVCTTADRCVTKATCSGGVCEVLSVKTCQSNDPCRVIECLPDIGNCVFTDNSPFGTPCDDHFPCSVDDRCESGICTSGADRDCDDANPCTIDSCDPESGECVHSDPASQGGDCDDGQECTVDSCDPNTGECAHDGAPMNGDPCDEHNLCTNVGSCNAGICNAQLVVACSDGELCTWDVCDPETGECTYLAGPANGLACDDGNPCTDDGQCTNSFCVPGQQKSCNDANPCTQDVCYQSTGCCVNNYYVYDGVPCNDGDMCTLPGVCNLGTCITGNSIPACCITAEECDDNNPCTENHCLNNQCVYAPVPTAGCCDSDTLKYCSGQTIVEENCAAETCGWSGSQYNCNTNGAAGPIPKDCVQPECVPQCAGKTCGSDGCSGSCGVCPENTVCGPAFSCLSSQSIEIDFSDPAIRSALDPNGDGNLPEFTDVILENGVQVVITTDAQISETGISGSAPFCVEGIWLVLPQALAYSADAHDISLYSHNLAQAPSGTSEDTVGLPGKVSIHCWAGETFEETETTEITIPFWAGDGITALNFQTPAPLKVLQLHFGEDGTTYQRITID